jgi:hypothetical protein
MGWELRWLLRLSDRLKCGEGGEIHDLKFTSYPPRIFRLGFRPWGYGTLVSIWNFGCFYLKLGIGKVGNISIGYTV